MSILRQLFGVFSRKPGELGTETPPQEAQVPEEIRPIVVEENARVYTAYRTPKGLPDIRRFDVAAINDAINERVATMEEGETVVGYAFVDKTGGKIAVVGKVDDDRIPGDLRWTVYAKNDWGGDWTVGAGGRWSI